MVASINSRNPVSLIALLIFASLVCGGIAYGQTATAPAAPSPTIITNADEVSLDLVVRDKKNRPVTDLKPGDITITDNGSPVKISDLRLVTGDSGAEHLVTFVFDRFDPSSGKNAREIAAKILKMAPGTGISFSVLKVDGRLKLLQEFTSEREALTKAIILATQAGKGGVANESAQPEKNLIAVAQTGTGSDGIVATSKQRSMARMMLASLETSQRIVQDQHAEASLAGMLALTRMQRQVKGRKIVVYFAQGMQLDSNGKDMLRSIIGAASQGGVSIYAIDTNGIDSQAGQALVATMAMGNAMSAHTYNAAPLSGPPPLGANAIAPGMQTQVSDQYSRFESGTLAEFKDPMAQLAVSTGGAYIGATDSLKKPLQRMIEDMTTNYEASFVPSIQDYDGRFRPVTVKPIRKGLKLRSRAGYFALPPDRDSGIRPFEAPLFKILTQQQLPTDFKFRSQILRMGDLPDGNANEVVVEVPLSEVEMHKDANTRLFSVHLAIVAQIKNKSGEVIEHFGEDIPRHGSFETMDEAQSEVISLQKHFSASPGEYSLETAILDLNGGKASAGRTNFEIDNASNGPSLSDMALVRRTEPFKPETDPLEPLRYENGKIVPDLSGDINNKAKSISLFFMIHPDAQSSEQPRLAMEVLRNGDPIASMPLPLRRTSGAGVVPYLASIQSGALPPGRYDVTATLTQGEKTTASSTSFTVDGAELASAVVPARGSVGPPSGDIGSVPESKLETSGAGSHQIGRLTITSITDPMPPPTQDQLQEIVEDARAHALSYSVSLPNFTCVEITDRSVDSAGAGRWKHKDTFAERLRYVDNAETRTILRVNGQPTAEKRSDLNGPLSQGEFGGVLKAVFSPSAKADFQYKETDALGSGTVNVLSYQVSQKNSMFSLSDSTQNMDVGFHGLVYIDSSTKSVRRITLKADGVPRNFTLHSTSITVDYDYVAIGTHDYLVPARAEVSLTQGKREAVLNEIEFRDYRRYASQVKVLYGDRPR